MFDKDGKLKAEYRDSEDIPEKLKDHLKTIESELVKQTALSEGELQMAGRSVDAYMESAVATSSTINRQIKALVRSSELPRATEFNKDIEQTL